jgi:hypothetical protein
VVASRAHEALEEHNLLAASAFKNLHRWNLERITFRSSTAGFEPAMIELS